SYICMSDCASLQHYILSSIFLSFFFNDPSTPEIYTLSLHDALPISPPSRAGCAATRPSTGSRSSTPPACRAAGSWASPKSSPTRSEEHTSELQSRGHLVCRLLLEKKKKQKKINKNNRLN